MMRGHGRARARGAREGRLGMREREEKGRRGVSWEEERGAGGGEGCRPALGKRAAGTRAGGGERVLREVGEDAGRGEMDAAQERKVRGDK